MGTYRCLFLHAFSIKSSFCQQNCCISRVFCVVTQLVSASNHEKDDGNSKNNFVVHNFVSFTLIKELKTTFFLT